jgi:hypothetical protein
MNVRPTLTFSWLAVFSFFLLYCTNQPRPHYYYSPKHPLVLRRLKAYRDTCTTGLPVGSVTFCTPFSFYSRDSRDVAELNAHAILTINYYPATLAEDRPDISGIEYYIDGKPRFLNLGSRSGSRESRDSLMVDAMRKIDAKYHTNYSQFQYGTDSVAVKFYKKKSH